MILVDRPYVSPHFTETARSGGIPVILTEYAKQLGFSTSEDALSEEDAIAQIRSADIPKLYSTSENAIGWIAENLSDTSLLHMIKSFKDKVVFRTITQELFPDLFFTAVPYADLASFNISAVPMPCIIKPAVGFFSMGVHMVSSADQWPEVVEKINREIDSVSELYPNEVLDAGTFIIEQMIYGEEFAIDAYYDEQGLPVIVGIYAHMFASEDDVRDRIYYTSKELIVEHLDEFTGFLRAIGDIAQVKNFPVHVELRRDRDGALLPIEVNPLRFGGWCTTADLTALAYGFNPYLAYFHGEKPDWEQLLTGKDGLSYSIIVLDNSTGYEASQIASFDYDALLSRFSHPLELRKIDYHVYPVFAFLFTRNDSRTMGELDHMLHSDLSEFIRLSSS